MRSVFVIIIIGTGVVAALFNRFAALLLYVWFALFRPQEWLWVDISSWRVSLMLALLLIIPSLFTGVVPNLTHPISIGMLLFLASSLVAQSQAFNAAVGWEWVDYLTRLIFVALLATTLVSTKRRFILLVTTIAVSMGFFSAKAGVASLLGGGVRYFSGQAGAFSDSNAYAVAIAMIIPFLWFAGQHWRQEFPAYKWAANGFFIAIPLSILTIISTFSRAGLLALIAAFLSGVALQKHRLRILAMTGTALLIALPFVPIPKGYFDRVETIRTYEEVQDDSALSRLHFWRVAMNMAEANPLGVGLHNFESAYNRYDFLYGRYGVHRAVHSSHFEVLADNGFAGAAIWLTLFGYAFVVLRRIRRAARDNAVFGDDTFFFRTAENALLISMISFVVGGAFIAMSLNDITWYTFSLVAALDRLSRSPLYRSQGPAAGPPC